MELAKYLRHKGKLADLDKVFRRFEVRKSFVKMAICGVAGNWGHFNGAEEAEEESEIRATSPDLHDEIVKLLQGPRDNWNPRVLAAAISDLGCWWSKLGTSDGQLSLSKEFGIRGLTSSLYF